MTRKGSALTLKVAGLDECRWSDSQYRNGSIALFSMGRGIAVGAVRIEGTIDPAWIVGTELARPDGRDDVGLSLAAERP